MNTKGTEKNRANNPSHGIIEAAEIHRSFGSGDLVTHVLKGISLKIVRGEFVAIMGKSGAGKSTLMYQLSVLDHPSKGSLMIDNTDVLALGESEQTRFRLNTLGYVFQDYALVPDLSARENVMVPLLMRGMSWEEARTIADASIDNVGLRGKYENLPAQLSGGEQQRTAIARAIAGTPKIIFADEPTANLDSVSGQSIIDLLGCLHSQGQTIVMVTHEEEYAKDCDRVISLEDGRIVSEKIVQKESSSTREPAAYVNPCYSALTRITEKQKTRHVSIPTISNT